jgi:hypothetical protein
MGERCPVRCQNRLDALAGRGGGSGSHELPSPEEEEMRMPAVTSLITAVALAGPLGTKGASAQGRDLDAEIEEAQGSAKSAAGFEWLGTLNRLCLLPPSRGLNTSDEPPRWVRDPSSIPPRDQWYAEAARVFDNLYFVGGSSTRPGP